MRIVRRNADAAFIQNDSNLLSTVLHAGVCDTRACEDGGPLLQVELPPDEIRLRDPRSKIIIDVAGPTDSECMEVIASRERLHLAEARMVQPSGQNDMAVQPLPARSHLRERHAHLEGNPGLLREDANRAVRPDDRNDFLEERTNRRRLAAEVVGERVSSAGV